MYCCQEQHSADQEVGMSLAIAIVGSTPVPSAAYSTQ